MFNSKPWARLAGRKKRLSRSIVDNGDNSQKNLDMNYRSLEHYFSAAEC